MRIALASLLAIVGVAPATFAQTPPAAAQVATPTAAMPTPPPATVAAPTTPAAPSAPAPAVSAPAAPAPAAAAPVPAAAAPAATAMPTPAAEPAPTPPAAPVAAPVPAPEAPLAPPPAPTDPTAIALLNTLETVCIPSVAGGNLAQAAKAAGYRKSGDNYQLKRPGFQFTLLAPGSNPRQCHVDVVHPIDPEAPAKPLIVALHNWAAVSRGWTLYRNDKNVTADQEFTTRSWEYSADGKDQALVLTTIRKADGTPSQRGADTSEMLYSISKTPG